MNFHFDSFIHSYRKQPFINVLVLGRNYPVTMPSNFPSESFLILIKQTIFDYGLIAVISYAEIFYQFIAASYWKYDREITKIAIHYFNILLVE